VSAAQTRAYLAKAQEYLQAAEQELKENRRIAATSLAIHAADTVTGARLGRRAAGQNHDEVLALLREAGPDGTDLAKDLARLLPLKAKAEYDPDDIAKATAGKAVERARRCVQVAHRAVSWVNLAGS
jgi:hypothetical protein